ncbi:hypothetical protein AVEN_20356-1 [Araneus ventricosus]|uniref:Uncharacterized protein n=1 Tax=Araneus ventricosus TaxID=182803 RepID=A0A4Y2A537_ARAVE|nr:hypothetical protein AVEN_20356-1 [Araneus ventricosus]
MALAATTMGYHQVRIHGGCLMESCQLETSSLSKRKLSSLILQSFISRLMGYYQVRIIHGGCLMESGVQLETSSLEVKKVTSGLFCNGFFIPTTDGLLSVRIHVGV